MSFIQTKPLSPGSECQKHAARGRNRVQTCTQTRRSHHPNQPAASVWFPALTSLLIASQNLDSQMENTRRECGCDGDVKDEDGTREQETSPGRTAAALGCRTTSGTTTPDTRRLQIGPRHQHDRHKHALLPTSTLCSSVFRRVSAVPGVSPVVQVCRGGPPPLHTER